MAQIIQEDTLGSRLGNSLGVGISSGLQNLANMKLNQLAERAKFGKTSEALRGLGYSQEQANQLAGLPDPILTQVLRQNAQEKLWGQEANIFNSLLGQQNQPQQQQMSSQQLMQQQGSSQINVSPLDQQVNQGPQNNVITGQNQQQEPVTLANLSKVGALRPGSAIPLAKHFQDVERHKENVALKKEALDLKKQEVIHKQNEPYLKDLGQRVPIAEEASVLLEDIEKLLDTGKVATGFSGAINAKVGTPFQNQETQQFIADVNKLIVLESQRGKGLPSKFRLLLEQAAKPGIEHKPEVQRNIINRMKKEVDKVKLENEIYQDLVRSNNGIQPKDARDKVRLELAKQEKSRSTLSQGSDITNASALKIGDPLYKDGKQYYWDGLKAVEGVYERP